MNSKTPASRTSETHERSTEVGVGHIQSQIAAGVAYTRSSRRRFGFGAISLKVLTIGMTGIATVVLGFSDLSRDVALAFTLTALVTVITAVEPVFNFRSRWITAEEALGDFHRLQSELDFRLATEPSGLPKDVLENLHAEVQTTWKRMNDRWVSARQAEAS